MKREPLWMIGCVSLVVPLVDPALAKTLEVGTGAPFVSISAAPGKVRDGDVIEVASGNYTEAVSVRVSVTIRGVDTGSGLPVIAPKDGTCT